MIEVLKQMVEALKLSAISIDNFGVQKKSQEAIQAGKQLIAELESQEPVANSVIAGVLFDFMGWLTSRKERIVLSSADNASPAVEAITEFAKMRNLSLDDAKVQDWHTHPPQRTWATLTEEEILDLFDINNVYGSKWIEFARCVEAKLKQKNNYAEEMNA